MKKKNIDESRIIYSLNIEDIQTVAEENFVRKLNAAEIEKIIDPIVNRISWYDTIYDAIKDNLDIEELDYINA
ncbi:MAG: hypothetical protein A2000_02310 [Ignavibacteria bacterium GWB2_36_8]|nr:MAG: hypothetical protein A2000_02310 [Ignavibacteria bacterium GWB2_36_8]OGU49598.1 MAG: hypothetical protein A2080_13920 [Ignavibacteria bacterium GWC2_36_12]